MPKTAASLGVDPTNLEQNVEGAAKHMANLLTKSKGDPFLAEIGYNAGESRIWSGQPLPEETYYHLQKIFPGHRNPYLLQRMPSVITQNDKRWWAEVLKK